MSGKWKCKAQVDYTCAHDAGKSSRPYLERQKNVYFFNWCTKLIRRFASERLATKPWPLKTHRGVTARHKQDTGTEATTQVSSATLPGLVLFLDGAGKSWVLQNTSDVRGRCAPACARNQSSVQLLKSWQPWTQMCSYWYSARTILKLQSAIAAVSFHLASWQGKEGS